MPIGGATKVDLVFQGELLNEVNRSSEKEIVLLVW